MAQLSPGIVFWLEVLGRRGQGPFAELLTVYALLFPQGWFPKAVWGFRRYFHSAQRSSVHTRLSQEGRGLHLHNSVPSSAAAAACLSDLWGSTITGRITGEAELPLTRWKEKKQEMCWILLEAVQVEALVRASIIFIAVCFIPLTSAGFVYAVLFYLTSISWKWGGTERWKQSKRTT